jgi:outer membrane protein assembly factor BamB
MLPLILLIVCTALAPAEQWTRFRGPNGSGVVEDGGYPAELKKDRNLLWRSLVRPGKSSPVLTGRHVFLTGAEGGKLYTQCFDRKTGKLLWERSIDTPREQIANRLNHPAAVSPVTDGESVYSFFKDYGFVSYNAAGAERWRTPMGPFDSTMGLGTSPILAGGLLILVSDLVEGSFIAALDSKNGEIRWKVARDEAESWGSPLLLTGSARPQILTASRGQLGTHRIADGKRLFTMHGLPTTVVGSPILNGNTMYVFGYGSDTPAPFSQRLARFDKDADGRLSPEEYGDEPFLAGIAKYKGNRDRIITEEEWNEKQKEVMGPNHLAAYRLEADGEKVRADEIWRYEKSFTAVIPSSLLYQGVLYFVKNGGILTSLDGTTGAVLKTGRVDGAIGGYSASPVAADGKIYLASEDGNLAVLKAGGQWEVLSAMDLGEPCYATPALSQGSVYLRTDAALYRFGSKAP